MPFRNHSIHTYTCARFLRIFVEGVCVVEHQELERTSRLGQDALQLELQSLVSELRSQRIRLALHVGGVRHSQPSQVVAVDTSRRYLGVGDTRVAYLVEEGMGSIGRREGDRSGSKQQLMDLSMPKQNTVRTRKSDLQMTICSSSDAQPTRFLTASMNVLWNFLLDADCLRRMREGCSMQPRCVRGWYRCGPLQCLKKMSW